jgi:hypothetical protein
MRAIHLNHLQKRYIQRRKEEERKEKKREIAQRASMTMMQDISAAALYSWQSTSILPP